MYYNLAFNLKNFIFSDRNLIKKLRMETAIRSYSVKSFLTSVKNKLSEAPPVWVHGVITQFTEKGNMVYMSIADFREGDVKPEATIALSCYAGRFAEIRAKAELSPTPFTIKEQLKVCFQIKADVYIPFGKLQGTILDIDPVYTMGELALTKAAILKRLALEGLLDKNKNLELADVPLRVGLITGEKTAAYKDFTTRLAASPFNFTVTAAYARMQGNETESSVIAALESLVARGDLDVICIVRGGGSKTDLNYFDSEALCRAVANCGIPVFTGIGHEIDKSLLDEVAYLSCITPTDCAKRLVERVTDSWNRLVQTMQGIADGARALLDEEGHTLTLCGSRLQQGVLSRIYSEKERHTRIRTSLQKDLAHLVKNESSRLDRNEEGLRQGSRKILDLEKSRFELMEVRVKGADPQTIIARGYTLTTGSDGKFIHSASELKSGDVMRTRFRDGSVESVVR